MDGAIVARAIYAGDGGVTTIATGGIIADDVLPQGTTLPAILIKSISKVYRNIPGSSAMQHVRERVQAEGHAATSRERRALMLAMWRAVSANRFPTADGLSRVTVHPESAGPDGISEASVRVGIQDLIITYSQERQA